MSTPSAAMPIGKSRPVGVGGATARSPTPPSACPTPSTSSSGTVRGIDVASDAVEASRTGASERATRSATSERSCSTSIVRSGTSGSVDHSMPVSAVPDCRAASTIAAWRGTSASVSASHTTLIPASGQCSRSSARAAGSGSSRPSRTARIHGHRRAARSRSGTDMRNSATSSSRATSSSAAGGRRRRRGRRAVATSPSGGGGATSSTPPTATRPTRRRRS